MLTQLIYNYYQWVTEFYNFFRVSIKKGLLRPESSAPKVFVKTR